MVASLLKVLSSGIQDERLSFSASFYPFQKVWNKTGRFTTRWERLDFENIPQFGQTGFVRLLRKGHLIRRMYLVATMPDLYMAQKRAYDANGSQVAFPRFGWTNSLGHALIEQLTLDIASSRVETLDSRLLEILDEFTTPLEKVPVVNEMIRRKDNGFDEQSFGWPPSLGSSQPFYETVVVPLPFWFCRGDPGCALPIDAISYDQVRCGITFRNLAGLYYTTTQNRLNTDMAQGASLAPLEGSFFYTQDPYLVPNQTPLSDANGQIMMPMRLPLGECYVMAEYVYLDQPESNRFRLADLQVPIVQHYAMPSYDTRGLLDARIRLDVPNPTRDIYFMCNPVMAPSYNAPFLGTRDMTGGPNTLPSSGQVPWWPDAVGLSADKPSIFLRPAFSLSNSEPISDYSIIYQNSLVRYRTEGCALFRSIVPSYDQRKSPWVNRYLYNIPLSIHSGFTPFSQPFGEANLDKVTNRELLLRFRAPYGSVGNEVGRFVVYCYAETYNVLRVFGGRAGLLFAY